MMRHRQNHVDPLALLGTIPPVMGFSVRATDQRPASRRTARTRFAISILLVVGCALTDAIQAAPLSPADVKTLLGQIREKRNAAPYLESDFREEKIIRLMNKPIVTAGKVWFQAPQKFRREVTGNSPSIMVSDGQQLWIYYPKFKSAEHYSLGKHSPLDAAMAALNTALNLENVETTFHITGEHTTQGYELELLPRSPSMKRLFQHFQIHISVDLMAERTEMLQPNGDRIVTTYSNQNHSPIPASTFEFKPPAGTDISTPLGR
jgi:outer membrane lipoprotein-sorting protein